MRPEDAEMIKILVQARTGVQINPNNTYQLESSLSAVARRENCPSVNELLAKVRETRDERIMMAIALAMTPIDTAFFRDAAPFEYLMDHVLPRLTGPREKPARIWSAACSTGQEAWSVAMAVEDVRARYGELKAEIYASDASDMCVEKGRGGVYTQFEVQRGLPIRKLLQYFELQDESWKVKPALADKVRWRRINLLSDISQLGRFEVIFARNVTGQFDRNARRKVLDQLRNLLTADGYLFLGVTEPADDVDGLFADPACPGLFTRTPPSQAEAA